MSSDSPCGKQTRQSVLLVEIHASCVMEEDALFSTNSAPARQSVYDFRKVFPGEQEGAKATKIPVAHSDALKYKSSPAACFCLCSPWLVLSRREYQS